MKRLFVFILITALLAGLTGLIAQEMDQVPDTAASAEAEGAADAGSGEAEAAPAPAPGHRVFR